MIILSIIYSFIAGYLFANFKEENDGQSNIIVLIYCLLWFPVAILLLSVIVIVLLIVLYDDVIKWKIYK